jgi:hypothetical protein
MATTVTPTTAGTQTIRFSYRDCYQDFLEAFRVATGQDLMLFYAFLNLKDKR